MVESEPYQVHLSLIIPVYNEEQSIGKSLDRILSFLRSQPYSSEIIIVDDGSRDRTLEIVQERHAQDTKIKIYQQSRNMGKGEAVKQGMLMSHGTYLFFSDADLSVPIETLSSFLGRLEGLCHIAIGTRQNPDSVIEIHQPIYRELFGKIYTILSNWILNLHFSDFTCGFKGFRKEAAKNLFSRQQLPNWSFDAEILYLATLRGYRVEEIPVRWRNDQATKVKLWRDIVTSFLGLVTIRTNHWMGKYK